MRLFVSADLEGVADEIEAVQERLADASGLRFTDPSQAHVTLHFLGDTDPDRVPELTDELEVAVAESGVEPFEVEVGGLGVFPDIEYIRVVWVGVGAGSEQLCRLQESIERRATALGFEPDDHEFTPHATIARMDHAGGKELVQRAVRSREPTVGTVRIEEVRLKRSELTPDGPEYSTVERFGL